MKTASFIIASALTLCAQETQIGPAPVYSTVSRNVTNEKLHLDLNSGSTWFDTSSRSTVVTSYLNTFVPSSAVELGWTGNVTSGTAGTTSQAFQDAVLQRINWFRHMAGLSTAVSFSATYNTEDQQAALMMSANGQLNHSPPSTWTYFSSAGADAAVHSNLCLEIPYLGDPGCIAQYMQDYGMANSAVGHRRWLLYPQTQNMGTGDVQPPFPTPYANAVWVMDSHFSDPRPATRDTFVAWPPKGFVPYQLVPGRWSFSYPGADFTNSTVTMQRNGSTVAVRLETPQQGFGENSVVWVPDNIGTSIKTNWPVPSVDTPILVTVSHVMVSGVSTTFTYTVIIIDPNSSISISGHTTNGALPLAGVTISIADGTTTISDSNGAYQFGPLAPGTYVLSATLFGFSFAPSSRSYIASTTGADFLGTTCDNSVAKVNVTANPLGGSNVYSTTLASGCPWTAVSSSSWLTLSSTSNSGIGPINISYSYLPNHNLTRTAVIAVAGKTLNIAQASAGQLVPGPANAAVFSKGNWVTDSNGDGVFNAGDKYFTFQLNGPGDTPLTGDWSGNGRTKAGIYANGFWVLDYNGSGQWDGTVIDRLYAFGGNPSEVPILGDWNGDGRTKIGLYINGFWLLDYNGNGQWDGPGLDRLYAFGGQPGEVPVVGDWNGDGRTKVGVFASGVWTLDYNGNGQFDGGIIDRNFAYSFGAGEKPLVGDWTGSGNTRIGVFRAGFWALNTDGTGVFGSTDKFYAFGGNPSELPIVGDWNGDGKTKIGLFSNGFWILDYNGNGRWDGFGVGDDRFFAFGGNIGEQPVPGKW